MEYDNFPYIAFWSPKDAPFICLEPWYGISDFVDATGVLEEKKGIEKIVENGIFNAIITIVNKIIWRNKHGKKRRKI